MVDLIASPLVPVSKSPFELESPTLWDLDLPGGTVPPKKFASRRYNSLCKFVSQRHRDLHLLLTQRIFDMFWLFPVYPAHK